MCGIVGIAAATPGADRRWLDTARDALRHRGPDDADGWWSSDGCVGLAHRRLAIIDLTAAGRQPMANASGELRIVFNGEIYNFKELRSELCGKGHAFRSNTDTEVLLASYREWGPACLDRLNGMFAFALYDQARRQLFMARDRAGEKPLFYALSNGALRFASELKSLLADRRMPRRVERKALDCYLAMGFVPGERCILEGIRKLPPAHALLFDVASSACRTWRYWRAPAVDPAASHAGAAGAALAEELEVLLEDAVRRQLVADVPIGVLLSGGVDSSLVTAMAARSAADLKTFTVRFPGHAAYDETEHARLIARHFGTDHVELEAERSTPDLLPVLARQFDEPIIDPSIIPTYLVSRLVREHCTVALGGDGGDELFGGYAHYNRLLWLEEKLGSMPRLVRSRAAKAAEAVLPVGFKGRNWLQALAVDLESGVPLIASYFDRPTRERLLPGRNVDSFVAEHVRKERMPRACDLLQRATRLDFENYLPEDVLVKVDRASMLNSLEVRAPLLDVRIIEFAFRKVPSLLKATSSSRKVLLKKLARRLLPPTFDHERKQGFSIPLSSWLQSHSWNTFFRDVLLGSTDTPFDRRTVGDLFRGQAKGRANSERLLGLVMFELWRQEYGVSM